MNNNILCGGVPGRDCRVDCLFFSGEHSIPVISDVTVLRKTIHGNILKRMELQ